MPSDKLIRGPQLRKQYLGDIDNSTLWRWRRQRGFPEPIKASPVVNLWRVEDVEAWLNSRRGQPA